MPSKRAFAALHLLLAAAQQGCGPVWSHPCMGGTLVVLASTGCFAYRHAVLRHGQNGFRMPVNSVMLGVARTTFIRECACCHSVMSHTCKLLYLYSTVTTVGLTHPFDVRCSSSHKGTQLQYICAVHNCRCFLVQSWLQQMLPAVVTL